MTRDAAWVSKDMCVYGLTLLAGFGGPGFALELSMLRAARTVRGGGVGSYAALEGRDPEIQFEIRTSFYLTEPERMAKVVLAATGLGGT